MEAELAVVRVTAGRPPRLGVVVAGRRVAQGQLVVRWSDDGHEQEVSRGDRALRFAAMGSVRLTWLLDPAELRRQFRADPPAVVSELVREEMRISTQGIKTTLVKLGLEMPTIDGVWPRIRTALKADSAIRVSGASFEWQGDQPDALEALRTLEPRQALERLAAEPGLRPPVRAALVDAVQAGLARPNSTPNSTPAAPGGPAVEPALVGAAVSVSAPVPGGEDVAKRLSLLREENVRLEAMLRDTYRQQVSVRAGQDRQLKIDTIRQLAALAIEVEELAANGAEAEILIERVRALAEINDLSPIGAAGETTAFDPARHQPLVGFPAAGDTVSVVRPGYTWHADNEDLLLEKAIVG
jgi:hypothetical protein